MPTFQQLFKPAAETVGAAGAAAAANLTKHLPSLSHLTEMASSTGTMVLNQLTSSSSSTAAAGGDDSWGEYLKQQALTATGVVAGVGLLACIAYCVRRECKKHASGLNGLKMRAARFTFTGR